MWSAAESSVEYSMASVYACVGSGGASGALSSWEGAESAYGPPAPGAGGPVEFSAPCSWEAAESACGPPASSA
eukprot:3831485-Alexandrium_andersonii.AAC.1